MEEQETVEVVEEERKDPDTQPEEAEVETDQEDAEALKAALAAKERHIAELEGQAADLEQRVQESAKNVDLGSVEPLPIERIVTQGDPQIVVVGKSKSLGHDPDDRVCRSVEPDGAAHHRGVTSEPALP